MGLFLVVSDGEQRLCQFLRRVLKRHILYLESEVPSQLLGQLSRIHVLRGDVYCHLLLRT
jgi:hypothetical protein